MGEIVKKARIRIGTWRYFWIATISSLLEYAWRFSSYGWKNKLLSWDETAPGKDAVMIVEMTRNNLEYYINLVDKAMPGFEWMTPSHKYILVWVKCYQSTSSYREVFHERKRWSLWQTSLLSYSRNCHSHPKLQQPPWSVSGYQHW